MSCIRSTGSSSQHPPSERIEARAREKDCLFVDERVVLDGTDVTALGRWIIQRLLKPLVDRISDAEHVLVVDVDTVFLRPQTFEHLGRYVVNVHWNYRQRRKVLTRHLPGNPRIWKLDFVAHHMLISTLQLRGMRRHVEMRSGRP